ncbi:MAG: Gfo/Idh/MocA family oxidoreductase, partial [Rhodospirillales bacterium]
MNLYRLLQKRTEVGRPVRVGLIGAGKFGSMFLSQVPSTPGLEVAAIADLSPDRAREACRRVGWDETRIAATRFTDDAMKMMESGDVEIVVEATGHAPAGIGHARKAIREGKHIVMVNVEADVLAGPLLAREAEAAGTVYSMAYGDQPALICEQVDWARSCGFKVIAAGKGTKYMPEYHASTPETVWGYYGLTPEQARLGGMNPQMFNSFLDGTKSSIEMAAVANATGLTPPPDGLAFPPCGTHELADVLRPGNLGALHHSGQVEVISSVHRDGSAVKNDLRWGVYVAFEAPNDYAVRCFGEYGVVTDPSGRITALYRPFHLIGLELNVSILSAALRGEPTGVANGFRGDVVSTAKRDLKAGETLDGEGGACVW